MLRTQYMKLPKGIQIEGVDNPDEWVLELKKNLYGGKDAGRNWYLYLKGKLESIGFTRSKFDECVFFRGECMCVLYTDDSILAGPNKAELDQIIEDIKGTGLDITDEGDIADFLGVNIRREGESFHLTQPKLIDSILEDLHLREDSHIKDIPMASSKLLSCPGTRSPRTLTTTSTIKEWLANSTSWSSPPVGTLAMPHTCWHASAPVQRLNMGQQ